MNLYDVKCMEHENDEFILPMIPGTEFSGEVIDLGPDGQQNFSVGDKVTTLLCTLYSTDHFENESSLIVIIGTITFSCGCIFFFNI